MVVPGTTDAVIGDEPVYAGVRAGVGWSIANHPFRVSFAMLDAQGSGLPVIVIDGQRQQFSVTKVKLLPRKNNGLLSFSMRLSALRRHTRSVTRPTL